MYFFKELAAIVNAGSSFCLYVQIGNEDESKKKGCDVWI
jgi:hypothetical protein